MNNNIKYKAICITKEKKFLKYNIDEKNKNSFEKYCKNIDVIYINYYFKDSRQFSHQQKLNYYKHQAFLEQQLVYILK